MVRRWRSGIIVLYWPEGSRFESGWATIDLLPQCFSSSYKNSLSAFKSSPQIPHQSFVRKPRRCSPRPSAHLITPKTASLLWNFFTMIPASSTGAKHLKYFLLQQQQQNQTIKNISSTSRLPDFNQKDAQFIRKLHIQVYPCHHVLDCR